MKKKEFKQFEKVAFLMMETIMTAIELKKLVIKEQRLKIEELKLKNSGQVKKYPLDGFKHEKGGEVFLNKNEKPFFSSSNDIEEELKEKFNNDPIFKKLGEKFNSFKNPEKGSGNKIEFPKGEFIFVAGKGKDPKECPCPTCVASRALKNGN